MINRVRRMLRRIKIKINSFRTKFDIVIINKFPHIKISEKHENKVKLILRILTGLGIVSSLFTFSDWYFSLLFSIGLLVIEQVFEQIIFTHTIMLVHPLPNNWDGSKWTGMIVATDSNDIYLGFGFSDKKVGYDFFNTLLAWNDGNSINDGNIQLTLVQEDKHNYSVHIYPTAQRPFVEKNIKKQENAFDKRVNAGKELQILVAQVSFCKVFPISPSCAYNVLKNHNTNVYIQLYDTSKIIEDDPLTYYNITPMDERTILFKKITVCSRKALDKNINTIEYYNVPQY